MDRIYHDRHRALFQGEPGRRGDRRGDQPPGKVEDDGPQEIHQHHEIDFLEPFTERIHAAGCVLLRDDTLLDTPYHIVSFGEDQSGELYVVHHDSTRGAIYKVVPGAKAKP